MIMSLFSTTTTTTAASSSSSSSSSLLDCLEFVLIPVDDPTNNNTNIDSSKNNNNDIDDGHHHHQAQPPPQMIWWPAYVFPNIRNNNNNNNNNNNELLHSLLQTTTTNNNNLEKVHFLSQFMQALQEEEDNDRNNNNNDQDQPQHAVAYLIGKTPPPMMMTMKQPQQQKPQEEVQQGNGHNDDTHRPTSQSHSRRWLCGKQLLLLERTSFWESANLVTSMKTTKCSLYPQWEQACLMALQQQDEQQQENDEQQEKEPTTTTIDLSTEAKPPASTFAIGTSSSSLSIIHHQNDVAPHPNNPTTCTTLLATTATPPAPSHSSSPDSMSFNNNINNNPSSTTTTTILPSSSIPPQRQCDPHQDNALAPMAMVMDGSSDDPHFHLPVPTTTTLESIVDAAAGAADNISRDDDDKMVVDAVVPAANNDENANTRMLVALDNENNPVADTVHVEMDNPTTTTTAMDNDDNPVADALDVDMNNPSTTTTAMDSDDNHGADAVHVEMNNPTTTTTAMDNENHVADAEDVEMMDSDNLVPDAVHVEVSNPDTTTTTTATSSEMNLSPMIAPPAAAVPPPTANSLPPPPQPPLVESNQQHPMQLQQCETKDLIMENEQQPSENTGTPDTVPMMTLTTAEEMTTLSKTDDHPLIEDAHSLRVHNASKPTFNATTAVATTTTPVQSTRKRKEQPGSDQSTTTRSTLRKKKMTKGKTNSTISSTTKSNSTRKSRTMSTRNGSVHKPSYGLVTPPDQERQERIPKFDREIKPLLVKVGYRFGPNMFAFPNMDPRTNPRAILGRDYFITLEAFRTNLCQYCIDDDGISWDENDHDKLRIWIRYNIIPFLQEGVRVPIIEGMKDKQVWILLRDKCGVKYVGGFYVLPNVDRSEYCELPGPNQNKFRDRRGHDGLEAFLARFGFDKIDTAQLTKQELLALYLYIASGDDPITFKRLHDHTFDLPSLQRVPTQVATRLSNSARSPVSQVSNEEEGEDEDAAEQSVHETSIQEIPQQTQAEEFSDDNSSKSPAVSEMLSLQEQESLTSEDGLDNSGLNDATSEIVQPLSQSPKTDLVDDDHDNYIHFPSFAQVRPLLEKVHFVFDDSLYARPGMDPRVNSAAEQGKDYFSNEDEFRKHLCAYGVGVECTNWEDDDQTILEDWVRFAIVDEGQRVPPPTKSLTLKSALTLLYKLGYQFSTSSQIYIPPGFNISTATIEETGPYQNRFRDLLPTKRHGLYSHLARFGIQGDKSKLSKEDLFSLQLYISACHLGSVFETKIDNICGLVPSARKSRAAVISTTSSTLANSATRQKFGKVVSKSAKRLKGGVENSPFDNVAVAACQQATSGGRMTSQVVARNIMPQLDSCSTETNSITVKEKLLGCIDALQGSFKFTSLSALPNTPFHAHVTEIESFMRNFADYDGSDSTSILKSMYICGSPGVGKTCSVLWCCDQVSNSPRGNQAVAICHVNVAHIHDKRALLDAMAETLGTDQDKVLRQLNVKSRHPRKMILVLDEIDVLVQTTKGSGSSGREKILQSLADWIEDPDLSVSLIGISNSVANHRYVRLNSICKFHRKITFEPYSKHDLVHLVQDRIGTCVVDPRALEFAASKIAVSTGDARQMLAMTAGAVKKCLDALSDVDANRPYTATTTTDAAAVHIVKMNNMMLANRDTIKNVADIVDGLPQMVKAVLCVAVTLAQARTGRTAFSLGELRRICLECLQWDENGFGIESFRQFIEQLVDSGLLILHNDGGASDDLMQADINQLHGIPIHLSLQLQDVESVLETTLEDREFYRGIVERARERAGRLDC